MEQLETQIVVKRNNLMSLFREDDRADAESPSISWELKDTFLEKDDTCLAKDSQSVLVSEKKLGMLAQLVHLWACGNHAPSSLSISKKAEEHSQDCGVFDSCCAPWRLSVRNIKASWNTDGGVAARQ
jgi:hypothetical protein